MLSMNDDIRSVGPSISPRLSADRPGFSFGSL